MLSKTHSGWIILLCLSCHPGCCYIAPLRSFAQKRPAPLPPFVLTVMLVLGHELSPPFYVTVLWWDTSVNVCFRGEDSAVVPDAVTVWASLSDAETCRSYCLCSGCAWWCQSCPRSNVILYHDYNNAFPIICSSFISTDIVIIIFAAWI